MHKKAFHTAVKTELGSNYAVQHLDDFTTKLTLTYPVGKVLPT